MSKKGKIIVVICSFLWVVVSTYYVACNYFKYMALFFPVNMLIIAIIFRSTGIFPLQFNKENKK